MDNGSEKTQAVEICSYIFVSCIRLKVAYLKADILSNCGLQSGSVLQKVGDIAGDKTERKRINFVTPFS